MKITILAIGKKHDPKIEESISDYSKRLGRYVKLEWRLLDIKLPPSANGDKIRTLESNVIRKELNQSDTSILLDERGNSLTSPEFANTIQGFMNSGLQNIVFIIGGAYGVDDDLFNHVDFRLSLSKLVFPHQLVRLILLEQIYRAHTILAGEKYHHV
jgi:23S rRNA (pseudouridine1915-N3)-methyltransferase